MNVNIPDGDDQIFYLRLLLTDEVIKSILQCTNVYAQRVINSSRPLRRRSVLNEWRNVTEEEIKKFLGLILHIGLVSMPMYVSIGQNHAYTVTNYSLLLCHANDFKQ